MPRTMITRVPYETRNLLVLFYQFKKSKRGKIWQKQKDLTFETESESNKKLLTIKEK